MDITGLRTIFKTWLNSHLRIDKWGLGLPESMVDLLKPPSLATDRPASEMRVLTAGGGYEEDRLISSAVVLPFHIVYRFDSSITYSEIPLGEAENYLKFILDRIKTSDCFDESIRKIEPTGRVLIGEGANGDRLIKLEIELEIIYDSYAETKTSPYFGV